MQAVVVLPQAVWDLDSEARRRSLFRRVAGVPLLIRVLASALRAGIGSVVVVHPRSVPTEWLREALHVPALSALDVRFVEGGAIGSEIDWVHVAPHLDDRWLWLPWNLVTLKATLKEAIAGTRAPAVAEAEAQSAPGVIVTRELIDKHRGSLSGCLRDKAAVPAGPGGAWVVVDSGRSAEDAERLLVRGSGKASDGIYSTFNRRLCRPVLRWLLKTPITANMVSLASIPVVVAAGFLYAQGYWGAYVAGSLVHFASVLLDEIDGMLARTKFSESAFGTWLDTVSDYFGYLVLWVGMSVGVFRQYHDPLWLALGALTIVMSVLVMLVLVEQRRRVSTPSAFHRQFIERLEADSANTVSRLIRLLAFLPRKAVMSHYVIWFSVLGLLPLFVALATIGSVVTLAFVVHSNRFFRREAVG